MSDFTHVPIVDLSGRAGDEAERRALAEHLRGICHEIGFVVVTGHGLGSSTIDDVFTLMDRFFALPADNKALIDKALAALSGLGGRRRRADQQST